MSEPSPPNPRETVPPAIEPFSLDHALHKHGLELTTDGQSIRWHPINPKHPRNWKTTRKLYDIGVITLLEFYTTALSASGSAAARDAQVKLGVGTTLAQFLYVSTLVQWLLRHGRVDSPEAAVVGRFITGLLSAIPGSVITGSIEDLFDSRARIWMMLSYVGVSNTGVVVGPMMSAYITLALGWKWVFYIASIVTGAITILLLFIKESRPSLLLAQEVTRFHAATTPIQTTTKTIPAYNPDRTPDLRTFAQTALFRPARLLFTEPIVFAVSSICGVAMGIIYLLIETVPQIYEAGMTPEHSSLPFLAVGVGLVLNVPGRIVDYRTATQSRTESTDPGGIGSHRARPLQPEYKLRGLAFATPVLAAALWWFAWTIPPRVRNTPWIVPTIPSLGVEYGRNELGIVLGGYLADSYPTYSASAFAAFALMRSSLAAVFPLVSPVLFAALGANVAVSVLAAVMTGFVAVPLVFRRYGEVVRRRSPFAQYSMLVSGEQMVDKRVGCSPGACEDNRCVVSPS